MPWKRTLAPAALSIGLAIRLAMPASATAAENPTEGAAVRILFIHHSCGGQLLADQGTLAPLAGLAPANGIYATHPNGGGLRRQLEAAGFSVQEASYGSIVGEATDIRDWPPKFATRMDAILATRLQDEALADGGSNRVVVFKSCFPNNDFVDAGADPGDPAVPVLTVANAKAAYLALLPLLAKHPEVRFIAMTAPPLALPTAQGLRSRLERLIQGPPPSAALARRFNDWLADTANGWLADYDVGNIAVFDYYDILTDHGVTDWSAYPTGDGRDSHPSAAGNSRAAAEFLAFITGLDP